MDAADIFEVRGYARAEPRQAPADRGRQPAAVCRSGTSGSTASPCARTSHSTRRPAVGGRRRTTTAARSSRRWNGPLGPGERRVITWTVRRPATSPAAAAAAASRDPGRHGPGARSTPPGMPRRVDIETDHEVVNQVIRRSMDDLCLLALDDPGRASRSSRRACRGSRPCSGATRSITSLQTIAVRPAAGDRDARDPGHAPGRRTWTRGATRSPARSSTSSGPAR